MKIFRKILPTFQTYCPVGVQIAQMLVHFDHFQVQASRHAFTDGLTSRVYCTHARDALSQVSVYLHLSL